MDVKELIPKDKFDEEAAKKLLQYSYEEIKPIVPQLLEWIQDGHWPVAEHVRKFLKTIHSNITPEIILILKDNDEQWKYQCIRTFGFNAKDILLKKEIERIALSPTQGEIEDDVHVIALETMNSWQVQ
jgi:hypothetical protein